MARRAKPTSRNTGAARQKKPATIDLEAKEVKPTDVKASGTDTLDTDKVKSPKTASKDTATSGDARTKEKPEQPARKSQPFGRDGAKEPAASKMPPQSKPGTGTSIPTSGSMVSVVASGVMGAVMTVLGLGAIGQFESAKNLPLVGSIFGSSGQVQESGQSSAAIDDQLAAMQAKIDALSSASQATPDVDLGPIDAKIAALEEKLAEIANVPSPRNSRNSVQFTELRNSLQNLEGKVAELDAATVQYDNTAGKVALAAVTARLGKLEVRINNIAEDYGTDLSPLETRLAAIEQSLDRLSETASGNQSALDELATQVESAKVSEKVARSVATNSLGAALKNNDALSIPISSLEALAGETAETKRLGELSRAGIASLAELSGEFDTLSRALENPDETRNANTITEKFWANARSLVSFRATGPIEGEGVVAVLSRIRSNLEQDNLDAVTAEWNKLPADAQEAGSSWIAKVKVRQEAFVLYEKISTQVSGNAG